MIACNVKHSLKLRNQSYSKGVFNQSKIKWHWILGNCCFHNVLAGMFQDTDKVIIQIRVENLSLVSANNPKSALLVRQDYSL